MQLFGAIIRVQKPERRINDHLAVVTQGEVTEMTWRIRRIISIILSVILLAFVSAAPFAYALEAEETPDVTESITETVEDSAEMTEDKKREEQAAESVQEEPAGEPIQEEPAAESATGEADQEKTETIYTTDEPDPTATVEIPDDDWGYIEQEVLAAHISDPTEETVHSEPEATPDATVTEAPDTEAPIMEIPITEAPITEAPIIEIPVTEQLPEETPAEATPAPAEENGTEIQHTAEEISEPVEAEKATEEPNSADETVQPETTGEDEEVTVTIVATMIDENIMKLHAEVHGPQEQKYYYQWQISEDGGKTYWDILGANEEDMEIELTDSNHDDLWRVWIQAI